MTAQQRFKTLRTAMIEFLAQSARSNSQQAMAIEHIVAEIDRASLPEPLPQPNRLPGCRHLNAAMEMARKGPMKALAESFLDFEPHVRWILTEHYRDTLGDEYMDNYCYANLLGYDALIPHQTVIVAFLVIGPGRHYPRHSHESEEIYFPFGGDTLWSQDDETPRVRPAGQPIHNTPWLPHEMITQQTPLFTFCFWISPGPIKLSQLSD